MFSGLYAWSLSLSDKNAFRGLHLINFTFTFWQKKFQGFTRAAAWASRAPVGGREHGQRGGVRSVHHHHHQRRHHHHHLGGVESVLARFISVIVIVDIFVYSSFLYFCKINILCFSSFSTFSWISTRTIKSHVYFYTIGGFPFIILLFHEVPESFLNWKDCVDILKNPINWPTLWFLAHLYMLPLHLNEFWATEMVMMMMMLVIMVVGGIPVTVSVSQSLSEAAEANFPPLYFSYLFSARQIHLQTQ